MKKNNKATINIAEAIATIIGSRDLIDSLAKSVSKSKANLVELDFKKVKFVSRSAAHALLSIKEDFLRKDSNKKELVFINANKDVETMLRIVAANRALPKRKDIEFKPEKIDINSLAACKIC